MNYMMLASLAATNMTFGERAAYAGRMLLVGMLMIFAVLTLLWVVLAISKLLFAEDKKSADEPKVKAAPAVPAPTPAVKAAPATPAPVADDAAIVAAITAAIAAARADEGCIGSFRVVSFRRAENGRAWNRK